MAPLVEEVRIAMDTGAEPRAFCRRLLASATLCGPAEETSLLVGVDALCRLSHHASEPDLRRAVLDAAIVLDSWIPRSLPVALLTRAPLLTEGAIYTGALDDVIEAATIEEAGSRYARLVTVIQDLEYLDELWLEAAVRSAPETFLVVEVAIRAARGEAWAHAAPFYWRALESLRVDRPVPRGRPASWPPAPTDAHPTETDRALSAALLRSAPRIRRLRPYFVRALGERAPLLNTRLAPHPGERSETAEAIREAVHLALRTIETSGFEDVRRLADRLEVEP